MKFWKDKDKFMYFGRPKYINDTSYVVPQVRVTSAAIIFCVFTKSKIKPNIQLNENDFLGLVGPFLHPRVTQGSQTKRKSRDKKAAQFHKVLSSKNKGRTIKRANIYRDQELLSRPHVARRSVNHQEMHGYTFGENVAGSRSGLIPAFISQVLL